ncbi:TonB-dependent receptor [Flavobacterium sp. MK4S-17]|uniref:SusC/RagA family TonB-linked outer membrane protein n=1 Tax=Flavobacterium sp. MK4S-17 TaxID=2543737 RepID=UPI00135AD16C|nr:TonB-dependent receptor [Flavobacterium sp. MK4S-17]
MKTMYQKLLLLLLMLPFSALAQSTLQGTVRDNTTGQPIPGVNVIVEGTTNGTSTDMDGNFTLTNVNTGDRIVFSFIGFAEQAITYNGQNNINVTLTEDATQLEEVVVIGYGSVKKKDATGSVTTVTSENFNKGTMVTAENLINGRVAGVTINTSGAPGSGSQIRIRGGSSLNASNDPLIVIDGLPVTNDTNIGSTSPLAAINPNDIESFTVLKDASATAIYGSRAANGVIIITTKRGGKELKVNYNFNYGSGRHTKTIDVFGADEFREQIMAGIAAGRLNTTDAALLGDANTNWQDEIYRRTDFIDNNLSLTGNLFKVVPARLSIGNTYQEGLRLTNKFIRNSASLSLNPSFFNDHLKFRVNANFANERNRFADGVEGAAFRFDPTQPVYDADSPYGGFFEYYNPADANNALTLGTRNPVAQLLQTHDNGKNNRIFGNVETEYRFHFMPELKVVLNLGFDESKGERTRYVPTNAASAPSNNSIPFGTNEYSERTLRNKLMDVYLNYNETFGKLNIDATAGYSYQKFEQTSFYTGNINDPNLADNFPETDIATDNVLIGFFGRANLSFNDKYLLTLSYRRDGSSRFSEDNRWGNFPAAAFAWKMNQDFFAESNTISDLKLRLGYGITGQQNFSAPNFFLQQYQIGNGNSQYVFGDSQYPIAVSGAYNPMLKWEETTTYNVGIDYGFFNNRITGAVDLFYKDSKDLLQEAPFPDGSNFSNRGWMNIGSFTTKGVEFSIIADVIKTQDFNWNVNFNVTKFERRIEELAFGQDILLGGTGAGTGGTAQIYREGFTPWSFYLYKQLYDNSGNPIEGAYADLNRDGIINEQDRYIYKNPDPDATFGFASSMNYKNFDFSFNLRASVGNRIYNAVNAGNAQYNFLKTDAALTNIPRNVLSTNFTNTPDVVLSDVYVENASFLRMDNITLGYTFKNWLNDKASVRLFTGVQNAFVITEYSGIDPEITNDGRDQTIYPRQRTFLFGANVNF